MSYFDVRLRFWQPTTRTLSGYTNDSLVAHLVETGAITQGHIEVQNQSLTLDCRGCLWRLWLQLFFPGVPRRGAFQRKPIDELAEFDHLSHGQAAFRAVDRGKFLPNLEEGTSEALSVL